MGVGSLLRTERLHSPASPTRRTGGRFYAWVALTAALIIFAGFARTFYLRSISGAPPLSPLLIVHGVVMTTWFVVFGAQVWLVSAGRTGLHRRLGVAGLIVAVLVVCVGVAAAIDAGRRGASPAPGVPPLMFMAIPLFDMPVFALLVAVALWQRRRPDIHKRLMLLATVGMLTPAVGRIPLGFIQNGGPPVFFGLALLVVFACIAVDTARSRALHPAFAWGGALIVAMLPLRLLVAGTQSWTQFARWLVG
ncbi:MAG TPA: hypothetical protein VN649_06080 [Ramlibacter sp.]|nr:hypothetical protein [Ramlibacter sp.]